ncbi:MAG: PfkB family carbohydrate kinase, partial [Anaerolineae bacterium]|nr:PfkB family carbohydrate kinase [Anaerolineae bacterium]
VVGHVTQDQLPDGSLTPGGTVSYAARTARAMGLRTAVLTSADDSLDLEAVLPGVEVHRIPAASSTVFENRYTKEGRVQFLHARAAPLTPDAIGSAKIALRPVGILHLGPVARECDPALVDLIRADFLGLTPQGWMRRWDAMGRVTPGPWEEAEWLLARADAVVLSEEDIGGDEALAARWAAQTRLLVVTRGARGCTLYAEGRAHHLPAFPAQEVDPTGAGDIFAAILFARLWLGDPPVRAARLANCIAALSVTRPGLSGTPTPEEIHRCLERINHPGDNPQGYEGQDKPQRRKRQDKPQSRKDTKPNF